MTREEAQRMVDRLTEHHGQFKAVPTGAARTLLGEERFNRLCRDKIRCHGHAAGYIYPWNVVDHLVMPL